MPSQRPEVSSTALPAFRLALEEANWLGEKLYIIGVAFVLLFITLVPLKQLIPAVALHEQMKATYKEIRIDAQA